MKTLHANTLQETKSDGEQHIIIGLIQNTPRVLPRLMVILCKMNFTMQYYKTSPSQKAPFLNMTMIVTGDGARLPQTVKQIAKLVDILEVQVGVGHG